MLYVCATPIGNLNDITLRALEILSTSEIILCEDTRTSKILLSAHHITYKRLVSMHEHNEAEITEKVLSWLSEGLAITQISDAGTPSISDPGIRLCNKVIEAGFKVSPIPGACAYISLLSVAGAPHPSLFYGFLPSNNSSRIKILEKWCDIDYIVCIYEAPHRIINCITSIIEILGENRLIIMGRELTKQFETIKKCTAKELLEFIKSDNNQQRGEFVLLIYPNIQANINNNYNDIKLLTTQQKNTLKLLSLELPPKKAVNLTHKIVGGNKELLYNYLISIK